MSLKERQEWWDYQNRMETPDTRSTERKSQDMFMRRFEEMFRNFAGDIGMRGVTILPSDGQSCNASPMELASQEGYLEEYEDYLHRGGIKAMKGNASMEVDTGFADLLLRITRNRGSWESLDKRNGHSFYLDDEYESVVSLRIDILHRLHQSDIMDVTVEVLYYPYSVFGRLNASNMDTLRRMKNEFLDEAEDVIGIAGEQVSHYQYLSR